MRTKVFKSGNSQAVRIPAEFAYADTDVPFEITRAGEVITIQPLRQNLKRLVAALEGLPPPTERELREPIEMPERGD